MKIGCGKRRGSGGEDVEWWWREEAGTSYGSGELIEEGEGLRQGRRQIVGHACFRKIVALGCPRKEMWGWQ